jgi:hypothetical protein
MARSTTEAAGGRLEFKQDETLLVRFILVHALLEIPRCALIAPDNFIGEYLNSLRGLALIGRRPFSQTGTHRSNSLNKPRQE